MSAERDGRPARRTPPRSALVVGGGVSGLVAARDLAARGLRVTLVEAEDHLGGAVGAHQVAGLVLDSGAESFATRSRAVPDLLDELGLGERVVHPNRSGSWLFLPEGAVPAPDSGILGIPADPTAPRLRAALGRAGIGNAQEGLLAGRSIGHGLAGNAAQYPAGFAQRGGGGNGRGLHAYGGHGAAPVGALAGAAN